MNDADTAKRIIDLQHHRALLLGLVYQYESDLRHPPTADSAERRLAYIESILAKVNMS
jgi:hypothetical protein